MKPAYLWLCVCIFILLGPQCNPIQVCTRTCASKSCEPYRVQVFGACNNTTERSTSQGQWVSPKPHSCLSAESVWSFVFLFFKWFCLFAAVLWASCHRQRTPRDCVPVDSFGTVRLKDAYLTLPVHRVRVCKHVPVVSNSSIVRIKCVAVSNRRDWHEIPPNKV